MTDSERSPSISCGDDARNTKKQNEKKQPLFLKVRINLGKTLLYFLMKKIPGYLEIGQALINVQISVSRRTIEQHTTECLHFPFIPISSFSRQFHLFLNCKIIKVKS